MNEQTVSTFDELHYFIDHARPGERCCYHRGFLSYDRDPETKALPAAARDRLGKMADLALVAADTGLITLTQRREGDELWSYIAVRTQKRVKPQTSNKRLEMVH
jgi:hypothetical protein